MPIIRVTFLLFYSSCKQLVCDLGRRSFFCVLFRFSSNCFKVREFFTHHLQVAKKESENSHSSQSTNISIEEIKTNLINIVNKHVKEDHHHHSSSNNWLSWVVNLHQMKWWECERKFINSTTQIIKQLHNSHCKLNNW